MDAKRLLSVSVFTFLPLLFLLRIYYGYVKQKHFGEKAYSIFAIAKMKMNINPRLVSIARAILGISALAYSVILFAIVLLKTQE